MKVTASLYTFSSFPPFVIQGISTKAMGSIKDTQGKHEDTIQRFATALGISSRDIIFPEQTHGSTVCTIHTATDAVPVATDGLFTATQGVYLGVVTADCLPIIFCDIHKKTIGIVHAGYKGLLHGIIAAMLTVFTETGSLPADLRVGIGPGIGVCCYTVTTERVALFASTFPTLSDFFEKKEGKYFLNLPIIAKQLLEQKGVKPANIEMANLCTQSHADIFYSHRASNGAPHGEFGTVIGIAV